MINLGIVAKFNRPDVLEAIHKIESWTEVNQANVFFEAESAKILARNTGLKIEDLVQQCNPLITLGGDGTLIRIARYAAELERIIIGVNFGNLGFLTETSPSEISTTLDDFLANKVTLSSRAMLKAEVFRRKQIVFTSRALNDAVILKSASCSLVELDIFKDQGEMMRLRADGLIFATPTGSTAYSLAAGGSIAYPSLAVLLITPICPHSLTNRPLIVPIDSEYFVNIPSGSETLNLTIDGQENFNLESGDLVKISKTKACVQFVRSKDKNYFEILRTKLHWARPNEANR